MSDPYALRAEDIQTPYKNIADMFFQQVGKFGDRVVLREKVDGRWTEISWNKLGDDVNRFAFGLRELGVEPKDVVAIISNNRSQWAGLHVLFRSALIGMTVGAVGLLFRGALKGHRDRDSFRKAIDAALASE